MIDFHSHILPKMDDGARSSEESIRLLRQSAQQGVTVMAATPHFYPDQNDPNLFVRRRQASWERLMPQLTPDLPYVVLGAEVQYFEGITRVDNLDLLKFQGTKLLLIEMPFSRWSNRVIADVLEIAHRPDYRVMLAHVERYFPWQKPNEEVWEQFRNAGMILQVNSSYFQGFLQKRTALRQLENGEIHVLGSDCHREDTRPSTMGDATAVIRKAYGDKTIQNIVRFGYQILNLNPPSPLP